MRQVSIFLVRINPPQAKYNHTIKLFFLQISPLRKPPCPKFTFVTTSFLSFYHDLDLAIANLNISSNNSNERSHPKKSPSVP